MRATVGSARRLNSMLGAPVRELAGVRVGEVHSDLGKEPARTGRGTNGLAPPSRFDKNAADSTGCRWAQETSGGCWAEIPEWCAYRAGMRIWRPDGPRLGVRGEGQGCRRDWDEGCTKRGFTG